MKNLLLFFLFAVAVAACRPNSGAVTGGESQSMAMPSELPDDFKAFYEKFHADSLYQMEHILWPLPGLTAVQVDSSRSETRSIQWEQTAWRMHRKVDWGKGDYKQEFTPMSESLIIERIRATGANYALERRFAKGADDDWSLIYYADMMEF